MDMDVTNLKRYSVIHLNNLTGDTNGSNRKGIRSLR